VRKDILSGAPAGISSSGSSASQWDTLYSGKYSDILMVGARSLPAPLGDLMADAAQQIDAAALTTFAVDPDGTHVRLHLRDRHDTPTELVLPVQCLTQLLMTLPGMICEALQNQHGHESLRVVYPLENYRLEMGVPDEGGMEQIILTLGTGGGFRVSFAAPPTVLTDIARAIFGNVVGPCTLAEQTPRLS
jgi:hypothetical protein